jgi:hypothetical protein
VNTCGPAKLIVALLPALVFWAGRSEAQEKRVRLRNESIVTVPTTVRAASTPSQPLSGLYLIQFKEPFQATWRKVLRAKGVDLLRYVPDDAFVARFSQAQVADVRALSFVQWLGEYRSDHKIHSALRAPAGLQPASSTREVRILLSPTATAPEIATIRGILESVRHQSDSRFGAIVRGRLALARLGQLASSPTVLWVEPAPEMKLFDASSTQIVAGRAGTNLTIPHSLGFDGTGVKVAIADSGLHRGIADEMHPDLTGRATDFFFYGSLTTAADEHGHGTHVAGIVAGNGATGETDETGLRYGLGVAPGARLITQRIFDGLGSFEPPPFETMTGDAVRAQADVGCNSWGEDKQGQYDLSAAEFDALVRDADPQTAGDQQYILEFSAGNAGPGQGTVGSPATAKNVIATGASQSARLDGVYYYQGPEAMADLSSRGPCEDGRIKPDLVAPGTWIASLRSPIGIDENAWAPISDNYLYQGGTSQAGPHVAGAAALLVQWFRQVHSIPHPSPALIKATLINSAVDLEDACGTGPTPNMDEGWGRLNVTDLFNGARQYDFFDQAVSLTYNQVFERQVIVASTNSPLKITLVYTDVPGSPFALPALVNDLDLEVVDPHGVVYRGNQFDAGESVPQAGSSDSINNVEAVFVRAPAPGEYRVRVRARNVPADARLDSAGLDQDFALVASGPLAPPGLGLVLLDRTVYTAPRRIQIKVIDSDLSGQPDVTVRATSRADPAGEAVLLRPASSGIVFTGSVATAVGVGAPDGLLQIAHGDIIRVEYLDEPASTNRQATALADLVPPVLFNVSITNSFGRTTIRWETSEDADATVFYGPGGALAFSATNRAMERSHQIALTELAAGQTNCYLAVSADVAGNAATNAPAPSCFLAVPPATVLLVNAYTFDAQSPFIDVTNYTGAITQAGVSYDLWDVAQLGQSPALSVLLNYRIVIWRINDSFSLAPRDTISPEDQASIRAYLDAGGSFFMASMEILSRLLDGGGQDFVTGVLHVGGFLRNGNPPCPTCNEDAGVSEIEGVVNDPIGDGVFARLDYSQFPSIEFLEYGPDLSDTFIPTTNAAAILLDGSSGVPAGVRYPQTGQDSAGRVVFFSFPLEAVSETNPPPSSRATLLRKVIQFLAPGFDGLGTIALDRPIYRVPDLAVVEVADSDLTGQGATMTSFVSTTDGNPVPVALHETIRPGLFRGYLPLVPATNPPSTGWLRVGHGATLFANYFDASSSVAVQARAMIDAVAPVISDLLVQTNYEEAIITWDTSELADSLVQFGESTFLGRTVYSNDFNFTRSVRLAGLTPDRVYYFRVVSRDAAGNTAVNDGGGRLHSFRTLRPRDLPFFDDLEAGSANWTVLSEPGVQSLWTLGTPDNGAVSDAHSGIYAWASNLHGDGADYINTMLVSPAFNLTGGNKAILRFWHSYDFTKPSVLDKTNTGSILVFTNASSDPIAVAEFSGAANFGWDEVEIDLSAYVGRVIYVVWRHSLFSFQIAPRPGWAIDDISITVTNVAPGVVVVSNNLAQSRFVLTGPMYRAGQGVLTNFTNATPGNYLISYAQVPWYRTPPPQATNLPAGGLVVFCGHYTFDDLNANGISDPWEMNYFGEISAERTAATDTDLDRQTDYAEFLAGTDPVVSNSRFELLSPRVMPEGQLELVWRSVATRQYLVEGTSDLVVWTPMSQWADGQAGLALYRLPPPQPGQPFLFRVQVRP